jgi:hypothetical protein
VRVYAGQCTRLFQCLDSACVLATPAMIPQAIRQQHQCSASALFHGFFNICRVSSRLHDHSLWRSGLAFLLLLLLLLSFSFIHSTFDESFIALLRRCLRRSDRSPRPVEARFTITDDTLPPTACSSRRSRCRRRTRRERCGTPGAFLRMVSTE